MSDLTPIMRLLEMSGAGGVLILGFIFLFRWLLPKIVAAFSDGMQRISEALREVNTTLREIQACQKANTDKLSQIFRDELRHSYERMEDSVREGIASCQSMERNLTHLEAEITTLRNEIIKLTTQLG